MYSRVVRAIGILLILGASIGLMADTSPAKAQIEMSDNDDSCISCHENLYLLHDTGKWYCLCETKARCTFCHGGEAGTLDEQAAHLGMIANPTQNTQAVCKSCHPDDYQARVATFISRAGVGASPCPTKAAPVALSAAAPPESPAPEAGLDAWQIAGLSMLGLAFAGLAIFAHRCWRADCLSRRMQP
jgi:hypothetical protein